MLNTTFSSFKNRNFRLFFAGQSVSLMGTWMQKTAISWVVYSLTGSELMLGISVFVSLMPTALFSLYGGIVADRYSRYKILLATQVISLLQAILLTLAVAFFETNVVWIIIFLGGVLGVINGFDMPARQSLIRDLIKDKASLPNALALNSSMVNLAKLIGPAIAGVVLEKFSDVACFGLNALSFIPVIVSLLFLKLPPSGMKVKVEKNLKREFAEAATYIKDTPEISSVLIYVGIVSFLVLPFTTLSPVFAKDIFNGSAYTLGIINGAIGLGAFVGALFLASLKQGTNLSKVLVINTLVFGMGLMLFSQIMVLSIALFFIIVGAFGMMSVRTISNTIVQMHVPNQFRGRVISIYLMILTLMMPIGSLLVSAVSQYIGVQLTVMAEGVIALIIALVYGRYLKKEKLRKEEQPLLQQEEIIQA